MTPKGLNDASCDPAWVQTAWEQTPWANIGIRTGPESGFWVLDLDGEAGIQALETLEAENALLPRTPTLRTGSGGRHLYFKLPDGLEIKNGAKLGGFSIDVRGIGGYVIGAGSRNVEGSYDWEVSPDEAPLAEAPEWLLRFVTERQSKACLVEPAEDVVGEPSVDPFLIGDSLSLDSDPGAGEGKRHTRACQLIGSHLGLGEAPEVVEAKALRWAKRCKPPMDEDDVKRIVADFSAKDAAKFEADAEPSSESRPWPELDETALHGLAGEIVQAIEPSTEADRVAILGQMLVCFGNVVGRGPFFKVEATPHHTNLFTVLVGDTAKGRKGTSETRVRELFRTIDPDWNASRVQNGLSSGEGLIWAVRDPIVKTEAVKEKGVVKGYQEVIEDHGISDKRLLVRESEFASVLKVMRRDGNTLSTVVRDAWDSGDLRTMTKNSAARATGAQISIIGHITKEENKRCMNDVDGFNGFGNRFLWLCVKRSKLLPDGGPPVDLSPFTDRLARAVEFAKSAGRMTRDPEAGRLWAKVYAELASSHPGLFGAITSRAEAQVLRLSMVYALLNGSAVIRADHLQAAMALWRYAEDSARYVFGDSTGDNLADKLLGIIRTGPATTKQLHDKTNRHHAAREIADALGKLAGLGLIRSEKVATGGRPAERWTAA